LDNNGHSSDEVPIVLLVEDTVSGQQRFRDLTKDRYRLATAANAAEAVYRYGELKSQGKPLAAIVVDLVLAGMPRPEGLGVIKCLRSADRQIPLVVWTKHTGKYRDECLQAGADLVLAKYEGDDDFARVISDLILRRR
jgi:CheY-like chemotaxis protein